MRRRRRLSPSTAPHWTPCPDEVRGLACPYAQSSAIRNVVLAGGCPACGQRGRVPVWVLVFEPAARLIHWTCPCGAANSHHYPEGHDHIVCLAYRCGSDVLRDDSLAKIAAKVLDAKLAATP